MNESNPQLIFAAITPIIEAFEGIIRATIDADLVAGLQQEHVQPLVKQVLY